MVTSSHFLSPRQLARAIGVSESSVKRWADEGRVRMDRTAGGHRRIPLQEAVRFVREGSHDLVEPDVLGLGPLAPLRGGQHIDHHARIRDLLLAGETEQLRALLVGAFVSGESLTDLFDGPIREAMTRVGERWREDDEVGVFEEHRATMIALTAITQLALLQPHHPEAPIAVGGAAMGDPSQLNSLMASVVLAGERYATVDLGANCPSPSVRTACERYDPTLVWVSVNHAEDLEATRRDLESVAEDLGQRGVPLILGGRQAEELRPRGDLVHVARSMGELAAFARGLRSAAR